MLYALTAPQFIKTLKNLTAILDKSAAYADHKKFDIDVLLQSRLAPDQFNLIRQIQITCDTAKLGCARLAGKTPPEHADTEKTFAEIKARIATTISYLETLKESDFAKASDIQITTPRWEGKTLTGEQYAVNHAVPNFYFHVTTAYSILRHNGVELGKKDFLGPMPFKA